MTTPPTTTLMIFQWRKMVPFVICRTRNSVRPFCVKQGFALDVIFQKETVCNFCLKKNVRLFFREAWNAYFIFCEMWKHRFILLETWSRPPLYYPLSKEESLSNGDRGENIPVKKCINAVSKFIALNLLHVVLIFQILVNFSGVEF